MSELEEAKRLRPGDRHYMAYVGPPRQYDFMGATQFRLLCSLGLRDDHKVLDFGCGSLRAGRLLIPYLRPGHYFGIEPNHWLVEDAIANQLGQDIVRIKRPQFSNSDRFDATVFDEKFDFIVAQSIFSHAGPDLTLRALTSFSACLNAGGLCAVTFIEGEGGIASGWVYPGCTRYTREAIHRLASDANLECMAVSWFHPRQSWYLLARETSAFPSQGEARLLHGAVLRSPEFRESIASALNQIGPNAPNPESESDRQARRLRRQTRREARAQGRRGEPSSS
ncbi:MAG: class I SAM-dependent methyltransferase [Alphaproteobacteria bacterium]|nr:class I SAM-dependent methyltransferase [Alphaproteobacteria bacterium]